VVRLFFKRLYCESLIDLVPSITDDVNVNVNVNVNAVDDDDDDSADIDPSCHDGYSN